MLKLKGVLECSRLVIASTFGDNWCIFGGAESETLLSKIGMTESAEIGNRAFLGARAVVCKRTFESDSISWGGGRWGWWFTPETGVAGG